MIRKMGDYPGAQLECADQIIATVDAARAQEQEDRYTIRTMTQNDRGQWVPAIPMPFVTTWNKYRCTCRKKPFWTLEEYKQHWVYEHVYQGRPERP
jgi:hypothetical protein